MVSSRKQLVPCPICNRADQVRRMQAAYEAGEIRVGPPPMPESKASMIKYVGTGMILVTIGVLVALIVLASGEFSWWQMGITLIFIVIALVLSFIAIRNIGKGDEEARRLYPIWDQAMANWQRLLYCRRDKVIFDSQSRQTLSESSTRDLLDMHKLEEKQGAQLATTH